MTTTVVHIRVDEQIKKQAAETLATLGFSVPDAVRIMLARVAAEKPYRLMREYLMLKPRLLCRRGEVVSFKNIEDLADLNAED